MSVDNECRKRATNWLKRTGSEQRGNVELKKRTEKASFKQLKQLITS